MVTLKVNFKILSIFPFDFYGIDAVYLSLLVSLSLLNLKCSLQDSYVPSLTFRTCSLDSNYYFFRLLVSVGPDALIYKNVSTIHFHLSFSLQ